MPSRRIVLLGPPGAGKGTQAKLIAEKTGLLHLSTGDILRDEVARGTALGRKAKEYMDRGDLVPDGLMINIVRGRVGGGTGFILDGFPRTVPQAEALTALLSDLQVCLDCVVNLRISNEIVAGRLGSRRTCRKCAKIYSLAETVIADPARCPNCGGELYQREDDRPETVLRRLRVYAESTAPVEEYYRKRALLRDVDGSGTVKGVNGAILALLGRS